MDSGKHYRQRVNRRIRHAASVFDSLAQELSFHHIAVCSQADGSWQFHRGRQHLLTYWPATCRLYRNSLGEATQPVPLSELVRYAVTEGQRALAEYAAAGRDYPDLELRSRRHPSPLWPTPDANFNLSHLLLLLGDTAFRKIMWEARRASAAQVEQMIADYTAGRRAVLDP